MEALVNQSGYHHFHGWTPAEVTVLRAGNPHQLARVKYSPEGVAKILRIDDTGQVFLKQEYLRRAA